MWLQMALNGEREKYFGELLQRETAAVEALCEAPGAADSSCDTVPEVQLALQATSPCL